MRRQQVHQRGGLPLTSRWWERTDAGPGSVHIVHRLGNSVPTGLLLGGHGGEMRLGMDAGDPVGPARVVLIDDSEDIRDVLRLALEREDEFEVVAEAADGQAGIDVVSAHKPHLVLLDLAMPLMDGLQALPHIRQASPGSVVVMLTGLSETAAAVSAVEQGAHGYIRKGAAVPELLEQIREVLEVRLASRSRALLRRAPADTQGADHGGQGQRPD